MPRKPEIEGALSAIFVIKAPRYDCSFVSLMQLIYVTFKWVSLSIFPWTRLNLNLEIKRRLNFNDFQWQAIFEIFQIWTTYPILERISPYISFFQIFSSNRPFICNHHQTIKLEADLAISRSVNTKLWDRIISLERHCWSNSQYSRRECLEITVLPDDINNEDLEEKPLMIFEKLEVTVDSSNVEDCHWLLGNQNKRFIIKLSKRKDTNKIRRVKKKLKGMNLSSIGITTPVY